MYNVTLSNNKLVLYKDGVKVSLKGKSTFETPNEIRANAYLEYNNDVATLQILKAVDEYLQLQGDYFKDIHCKHNPTSDHFDPNWITFPSLRGIEEDGEDGIDTLFQRHVTDIAYWTRMLESMPDATRAEVCDHRTLGYFIEDMEDMVNDVLGGLQGQKRYVKPYNANFNARISKALKGLSTSEKKRVINLIKESGTTQL
jgi:hypothetical protein